MSNDVSGQEDVDAAGDQAVNLLGVSGHHLIEGHVAPARVVDVRAQGQGLVGRPDAAGDEARLVGDLGA